MGKKTPEMRPYTPSIREKISNFVHDLYLSGGMPNQAKRVQKKTSGILDYVPVVGDAIGAEETLQDYNKGDYIGAGIGGAATAIGLLPGLGPVAGKAIKKGGKKVRKGIKAFHGSPHDFEKFSMVDRGHGVGDQAFGDGHYLADTEKAAEVYAARTKKPMVDGKSLYASGLSGDAQDLIWKFTEKNDGGTLKDVADIARGDLAARQGEMPYSGIRYYNELIAELDAAPDAKITKPSHMYEVEIDANPEDFLHWDAPSSKNTGSTFGDDFRARENIIGRKAATKEIEDQGFKGITYDVGKSPTRKDYVVFDDKIISIVKKYGIAGALALGLISKQQAEQMFAQKEQVY